MNETGNKRSGFVGIIGAPNAGKSTLINKLVGTKVSIVSPRVQTTRVRVMGIVIKNNAQIVFVDTPGIFAPKKRLDRAMVSAAWRGAEDAEAILLIVDAARPKLDSDSEAILARLKEQNKKALLVLNKTDLANKETLLKRADELFSSGVFERAYMISALTGDGIDRLLSDLAGMMPESPWMFPEDQITDMPMRLLAAEITREKIFLQLREELPYAVTVETESWEEFDNGDVKITQVIFVMRDSQKAIALGKGGSRIKEIGQQARLELEEILGRRAHLSLFVKVRENWADDPERYRDWGLEFDA